MKAYLVCIATATLLVAPAGAQSIMEHAAAAAGATIGTGAGKALSNGIDKVLGKAAETGSNAAKPAVASRPPSPPAVPLNRPPAVSQSTPAPASQHARSRRSDASADRDKPFFAAPQVSEPAPAVIAAAPAPPTAEALAKVKEGDSRADVLALGVPSSHITIPDDGHLIEILSYSDGNRRIGAVRIDNGKVVTVSVAQVAPVAAAAGSLNP